MHDDVIIWKLFPRCWPFVRVLHRWPVNSPHKGQWRGALMFSSICAWIKGWVNTHEAGNLRRYRARYDIIVMIFDRRGSPRSEPKLTATHAWEVSLMILICICHWMCLNYVNQKLIMEWLYWDTKTAAMLILSSYIDVQFEDADSLIEPFTLVYKNFSKLWE